MKTGKELERIQSLCGTVLFIMLLIYFLISAGQRFYITATYDYPKELREMNDIKVAAEFAQGNNPYALSTLDAEIPEVTNDYGVINPLIYSAVLRLFSWTGCSALQLCEYTALLFELAGVMLFYATVRIKLNSDLLAMFGSVLFFACYWSITPHVGAYPHQLALTLSILLMLMIELDGQKRKYRPFLYAGILVLLFYVKQYYVLLTLGVLLFFLIHDIHAFKRGVMGGILFGAVSVAAVNFLLPLYFTEVFPLTQGATSTSQGGVLYSARQLKQLLFDYYPEQSRILLLTVVVAPAVLQQVRRRKRDTAVGAATGSRACFSYEACQVIAGFVPTFFIAQNIGTYFGYYLQLVFPYLILLSLQALCWLWCVMKDGFASRGTDISFCKPFLVALVVGLSLGNWQFRNLIFPPIPTQEERAAWTQAYEILDKYKQEGEILVSPHLAQYCLQNGIETSDWGQADCNSESNLTNWGNNFLWRSLFPRTEDILLKNITYNAEVEHKVRTQQYSCIALTSSAQYRLPEGIEEEAGYKLEAELVLVTGAQQQLTRFYVRQ